MVSTLTIVMLQFGSFEHFSCFHTSRLGKTFYERHTLFKPLIVGLNPNSHSSIMGHHFPSTMETCLLHSSHLYFVYKFRILKMLFRGILLTFILQTSVSPLPPQSIPVEFSTHKSSKLSQLHLLSSIVHPFQKTAFST